MCLFNRNTLHFCYPVHCLITVNITADGIDCIRGIDYYATLLEALRRFLVSAAGWDFPDEFLTT